MIKEDIFKSVNDLINTSGFTSQTILSESFTASNNSLKTNFRLELANSESDNIPNRHSFKIEEIEDIPFIWTEITELKNIDANEFLESALSKFNIDKSQSIYIILIILK